MANNSGTLVIAPIRPQSDSDNFPATWSNDALGGWHQVPDISGRDSIPSERKEYGMACYVNSISGAFIWTNQGWNLFAAGSGGGGSAGATGATGATGVMGVAGISGSRGATGLTGATGVMGATGISGVLAALENATNADFYPVFVNVQTGTQTASTSQYLKYNPSTKTLQVNGNRVSMEGSVLVTGSYSLTERNIRYIFADGNISSTADVFLPEITSDWDNHAVTIVGIGSDVLVGDVSVYCSGADVFLFGDYTTSTQQIFTIVGQSITVVADLSINSWRVVEDSAVSGATGATGVAGSNGATGATGVMGATGISGAMGATGLGATGATGIMGTPGISGNRGATGATGLTGATGADFNASLYTPLTTTATISGNLQSQIDSINLIAGFNIIIEENPNNTWTISSAISGSGYQGRLPCNNVDTTYTINHPDVNKDFEFPVVSLDVPTSGSGIFVQGIYDRTNTSFSVVLSSVPAIGYGILWHISTTGPTGGASIAAQIAANPTEANPGTNVQTQLDNINNALSNVFFMGRVISLAVALELPPYITYASVPVGNIPILSATEPAPYPNFFNTTPSVTFINGYTVNTTQLNIMSPPVAFINGYTTSAI